jgi:hypothetical protein
MILALATFASVRSANAAARVNERSLMAGLRPVLSTSREEDRTERIMFGGGHWVSVQGHCAVCEEVDGILYMAMALRNVGAGLAVIHGWNVKKSDELLSVDARGVLEITPPETDDYRRQHRDLYIPAGDTGFWQGAIRDPEDRDYAEIREAIADRRPITIHLMYGDHEGGQRTVSRFSIIAGEGDELLASVTRYWYLDRDDPR